MTQLVPILSLGQQRPSPQRNGLSWPSQALLWGCAWLGRSFCLETASPAPLPVRRVPFLGLVFSSIGSAWSDHLSFPAQLSVSSPCSPMPGEALESLGFIWAVLGRQRGEEIDNFLGRGSKGSWAFGRWVGVMAMSPVPAELSPHNVLRGPHRHPSPSPPFFLALGNPLLCPTLQVQV